MAGVDPQEFGELKGKVEATHDMLSTFIEDYKDADINKRVTTIETRNKMVAKSAFGAGALYGGWAALRSWFF